jgi:hypothetical protein
MSRHHIHGLVRSAISGFAVSALSLACVCAASSTAGADTTSDMLPPGYSLSLTGNKHDFDFFVGGWITKQRRLKATGVGSSDWEEFPAVECLSLYLDGLATVDELYMPTKGKAGLTLRAFDFHKNQWSIYWVGSTTGQLDPVPVVGGFQGNHGEFYAQDELDHRPVKVKYTWDKIDHDHARWQQAFSFDNQTWETNWIGEFTRADASKICENGLPKR